MKSPVNTYIRLVPDTGKYRGNLCILTKTNVP